MHRPLAVRSCSECAACGVRAGAFVAGLGDDDLSRLDRVKISHSYRRGHPLFYEGNPCTGVFCVRSAFVKLVKTAPHGRRYALALAGPGDLLGLEAAVAGEPHGYGAEIVSEGMVCQIERAEISRLLEAQPAFRDAAMQHLAQDLRQSERERAHLVGGDARLRTAHLILTLASRFGERVKGQLRLDLDLTRADMAEMIGVAEETAIRELSELRRRGIVSTKGRSLVVEDPDRLARLARGTGGAAPGDGRGG